MRQCIKCDKDIPSGYYCEQCKKKEFPLSVSFGEHGSGTTRHDFFFKNLEDISKNCAGWEKYYTVLREGVCFGFVFMWGTAVLHNELPRYYRRLNFLTNDYQRNPFVLSPTQSFDTLSAFINYVTEEYRAKIGPLELRYQEELKSLELQSSTVGAGNLFNEKYKSEYMREISALEEQVPGYSYLLEMRAFLDGVLLYLKPNRTSLSLDLHKKTTSLDTDTPQERLSHHQQSVLLSRKHLTVQDALDSSLYLEHKTIGNLKRIFHRPYVFDKMGWYFFLEKLLNAVKKIKSPTFIMLDSSVHGVGLYLPPKEHSFILYDSNLMWKNRYYESLNIDIPYNCFVNPAMELQFSRNFLALDVGVYAASKAEFMPDELDLLQSLSAGYADTYSEEACVNSLILYIAALFNHADVITYLAQKFGHTINPNQYRRSKQTPIFAACAKGYANVVESLAKGFGNRINPNLATEKEMTPLFAACIGGFTDVVWQLAVSFRGRIDPNIPRYDGRTALYVACEKGYSDVILILFEFFDATLKKSRFTIKEVDVYRKAGGKNLNVIRNLEKLSAG